VTVAYRFESFEVRPAQHQLLMDGEPVALGQRALDVLFALIERRGRLVSKNELLDLVWPGLVVEENNLQVQISNLRKLLGPTAIATVPGRGYRFTGALVEEPGGNGGAAPQASAPAATENSGQTTRRTNLPRELAPLYGRSTELRELGALLQDHRLVTAVGAGGIGKSCLAQAAAHGMAQRWPDGAWMVELAGLADPALVPNVVAQAVDIKRVGQSDALDGLVAGLASRKLLLVLDNCEHLLDATTALVQAVLRGTSGITILATSQEPLRVQEEQQYRVVPLAVPAEADTNRAREFGAVTLFDARVRGASPRFELTDDNVALVIEICRRLDGLPLAIELAAARVATLGLSAVRDKLDARFRLLTAGSRATLRRHQTLRAALEWSYKLLNDAERTVFERLGVFSGGFTAELAQRTGADAELDEWAVLDHLSALVDKSLVVADAGEVPRYRLLESARAFALEQLAVRDSESMVKRHAVVMRDFLVSVDSDNLDGMLRTDQYAALVLPELDNLRAAYAWATGERGEPQIAVALAAHAGSLIDHAVECADWLLQVRPLVLGRDIDVPLAARYWRAIAAGNMSGRVPWPQQVEAAERACTLYQTLGQPRRVFSTLIHLSRLRGAQRDQAAARKALDDARRLIASDWPAEFPLMLIRRDGGFARDDGRFDDALALFEDAVRACAAIKDWRLEVIARSNIVNVLWQKGSIEEAARTARLLADELRVRPAADPDMDGHFAALFSILSEMGLVEEACAAAREALAIMRRTQNYYVEEWAYLFWRSGDIDTASRLLGVSDAHCARAGAPLYPNQQRLVDAVRCDLQAVLEPQTLARKLAGGAALSNVELATLIFEALEGLARRR